MKRLTFLLPLLLSVAISASQPPPPSQSTTGAGSPIVSIPGSVTGDVKVNSPTTVIYLASLNYARDVVGATAPDSAPDTAAIALRFIDDVTEAAQKAADCWDGVTKEIISGALPGNQEAAEQVRRKYELTGNPSVRYFYTLQQFDRYLGEIDKSAFGTAWSIRIERSVTRALGAKGNSHVVLKAMVADGRKSFLLNDEQSKKEIKTLRDSVEIMYEEVAELKVIAASLHDQYAKGTLPGQKPAEALPPKKSP